MAGFPRIEHLAVVTRVRDLRVAPVNQIMVNRVAPRLRMPGWEFASSAGLGFSSGWRSR